MTFCFVFYLNIFYQHDMFTELSIITGFDTEMDLVQNFTTLYNTLQYFTTLHNTLQHFTTFNHYMGQFYHSLEFWTSSQSMSTSG